MLLPLATVNNAAMNIGVQVSEPLLAIVQVVYLEVELLDHMVNLCLKFWGTTKLFSIVAAPFHNPLTMHKVPISPHPHLLTNTYYFPYFKNNSYPNGYVVVSHCGFFFLALVFIFIRCIVEQIPRTLQKSNHIHSLKKHSCQSSLHRTHIAIIFIVFFFNF